MRKWKICDCNNQTREVEAARLELDDDNKTAAIFTDDEGMILHIAPLHAVMAIVQIDDDVYATTQ